MTQCMGGMDGGLARICEAAKKDSQRQFNNLYHHLTAVRLNDAYFNLKRQAATGVDDVTWKASGENLAEKI